jgi:hypothetical protein
VLSRDIDLPLQRYGKGCWVPILKQLYLSILLNLPILRWGMNVWTGFCSMDKQIILRVLYKLPRDAWTTFSIEQATVHLMLVRRP